MQEWIVAMLVISVLLVLRDMAKVFFRGRSFLKAEQPAEMCIRDRYTRHPGE